MTAITRSVRKNIMCILASICTLLNAEENSFFFCNIVPCTPGKERARAEEMIELERRTGIRDVLYCLTLHPEGFPASRKAKYLTASYRSFAKHLKGSRVRPGVLMQSILGHWARVDKNEEKWTRAVNIHGQASRFCPLDPYFREYIFRTAAALAKEHPSLILIDDDVRSWYQGAECFCPLHVAEFNRRSGQKYTSQELRKAVLESKIGDPVQKLFAELQKDTVLAVCNAVRKGIDSVDHSIPAGTCMPDWDKKTGGESAVKIAGKNKPVMRIASPLYMEQTSLRLPADHLNTLALREFHKGRIPCLLDEADTCPHSLFSKSAVSFHTKLCSAMFAGMNGAVIWFVNGTKNGLPVSRKYTDILEKYRKYDQVLAAALKNVRPEGVIIPVYKQSTAWYPKGWPCEGFLSDETWVPQFLGVYGIPFRVSFSLEERGIYALSGTDSIDRMTDAQIRKLLTGKVLLDGPAVETLTRRGFSDFLGVRGEKRLFRFNREKDHSGNGTYTISRNENIPYLSVTDPKAEILTDFYYAPFSGSPDLEKAAPAAVLYRNKCGGVICSTAFHFSSLWAWANPVRKIWLRKMLEKLNAGKLPYTAAEDQSIMLLHRSCADGRDLLGLFNLGFDPLEKSVFFCACKPEAVEHLTLAGTWEKLSFTWDGKTLSIPVRIECYEQAVFRITPSAGLK